MNLGLHPGWTSRGVDIEPPSERPTDTGLLRLQEAIQRRDLFRVVPLFISWVDSLDHESPEIHNAAQEELQNMSAPVLSEILRNVDPLRNTAQDPAYGLNLSRGMAHFCDATRLNDEFGVRAHYVALVQAMRTLMAARQHTDWRLLIMDYEVMIRCAGAAIDFQAATFFYEAITEHGFGEEITKEVRSEFYKARYMTEPLYYQFDRARILHLPRDNVPHVGYNNLHRLDRLRYNLNALQKTPYNRMRGSQHQDNRRMLRARFGGHSFQAQYREAKKHGILYDEDFLITSMICFSRANALDIMKHASFSEGFGVYTASRKGGTMEKLRIGRREWRYGNPRRPTTRFLNALVEALGSMSRIGLAIQLIRNVSLYQDVPITREVWSNLLQWTYVCTGKVNTRMQQAGSKRGLTTVKPEVLFEIWDTMTEEFGFEPTFDDYTVYVKTLFIKNGFTKGLDVLRTKMIPHYRSLVEQHKQAIFDDVLRADLVKTDVKSPSPQRVRAEVLKEYAWYQIQSCLLQLFKASSRNQARRKSNFTKIVLPNIILEFDEFLTDSFEYRTEFGYVSIRRHVDQPRWRWYDAERETLPQRLPWYDVKEKDKPLSVKRLRSDNWPTIPPLKVKHRTRHPYPRQRVLGKAPPSFDLDRAGRQWWKNVERDLMM